MIAAVRIVNVVGARPNFVKVAALHRAQCAQQGLVPLLVHTGQHGEEMLASRLFAELDLPVPDVSLGIEPAPAEQQRPAMIARLTAELPALRPDLVVVVGDVTSTVAAAIAAREAGVPVAHVEAGLRCGDLAMPEERNRIETDQLSALHFASEPSAVDNLTREGFDSHGVHHVGNVMIDTLVRCHAAAVGRARCRDFGLEAREYAVVTLHRRGNLDDAASARELLAAIVAIARHMPVVFPLHPRAKRALAQSDLQGLLAAERVFLAPPQSYLDMLSLTIDARLVATDSGGLQEETSFLGIPCLTLRDSTERPVTVTHGTNRIAGRSPASVLNALELALSPRTADRAAIEGWDGHAAERVVAVLTKFLH